MTLIVSQGRQAGQEQGSSGCLFLNGQFLSAYSFNKLAGKECSERLKQESRRKGAKSREMKGALLGIGLAALAVSLPGMEAEKTAANLKQLLCSSLAELPKGTGEEKRTAFLFPSRPVGSSDGRRDGENSV